MTFLRYAKLGWIALAFTFAPWACSDEAAPGSESALAAGESSPAPHSIASPADLAPAPPGGSPPRVLFLGTSLTAGYGLSKEAAYPSKLAQLLQQRGLPIEAVNAGVSGDTSAGGLERLAWLLREPPEWILVELGANDGLRGLPVEMTEANLREVITRSRAQGARAIIAGMVMPPNYGEDYARQFADIFPRLAAATDSPLVPFLLEGVAGEPELNLADGIHPNPEGHARIARTLLPFFIEAFENPGR